jgi:hypothetical protein
MSEYPVRLIGRGANHLADATFHGDRVRYLLRQMLFAKTSRERSGLIYSARKHGRAAWRCAVLATTERLAVVDPTK